MDEFTQLDNQESGCNYYDPQHSGAAEHQSEFSPLHQESGHDAKKRKKGNGGVRLVATALCCSLLGGIAGAGGTIWYNQYRNSQAPEDTQQLTVMVEGLRETSKIEVVQVDTSQQLTSAEVYAANVNSTVGITTSTSTTNFWGYTTTSAASGSGFIISTDGYILTNYHVIEDADSVTVALYSGDTYDASLVGYDESNDIAVLKIDAEDLSPVILGDSDTLHIGDSVVAIGNPLGELTFSLTAGTISAKDREVTLSSNITMNLLQTDCAINSGNSGGALFNLYGEVVGITNAKYSSSSSSSASIDNIGFAIPINSVMPIVESIIEKGYISKPYIGITVMDVSEESQLYGVPAGIAVQSVTEGSPAEEGGLTAGDVITGVNGDAMDSDDLVSYVKSASVGDTLTLSIYRQGETLEITVSIGEQIQSALANEEAAQQEAANSTPQSGMPFGGYRGRP
ncbi:MAG: trypsin-like peptidase domain-containing protein [Eubacteriales bacterium]|nr:trypsin-like peptidase domain-containing protein [Eubacteriales bacterium]